MWVRIPPCAISQYYSLHVARDGFKANVIIKVKKYMKDLEVRKILKAETKRQRETIELIASENFVSDEIKNMAGSIFCNKYTEGYPGNRYYGGCERYDELESLCQKRWLQVFNAENEYHCNVQPHSGSQANFAAYMALLKPGDTILSMSLDQGGHLSHGSSVNFSGKLYNVIFYNVKENGIIDYDDIEVKIRTNKPKLILAGASAYSREINFLRIKNIITKEKVDGLLSFGEEYNPYFMVDMAHIAGLIAAGDHQSPFGLADVITTTTHKTLRGPRGGLIFCKKELARKIDKAVFPGSQGGPLQHIIAAKAVCALECLQPEYKEYIHKVVKNTAAMCNEFIKMGYNVITGGTDNHLFLLDLTKFNITGKDLQEACDKNGITLNKNAIPNDPLPPNLTSGVRIGCAAETTRGLEENDFRTIARKIDKIINEIH